MSKFIINVVSLKIEKTSNTAKVGLAFNKKDMIFGMVVESPNLIEATDALNAAELKWREWIAEYNMWVTAPDKSKFQFKRAGGKA